MNKTLRKTLLGISCFLATSASYAADKYEAEDAILDKCQKATEASASGGAYVKMQSGNLTFNITVPEAGTYDINIFYTDTYGGPKTQNLVVNGISAGSVTFAETSSATDFVGMLCTVKFQAGENEFSITNSWGWVDIDYITVEKHGFVAFDLDKNLATPDPIESAKELYKFLSDNFGKKTISGVMTDGIYGVNKLEDQTEIKFITSESGKAPALVGFDFLHSTGKSSDTNSWHQGYSTSTETLGLQLWKQGGIPAYCWHWKDPRKEQEAFYNPGSGSPSTDFDFTKAFKAGTTEWDTESAIYQAMINDIDIVSLKLKTLQCKGVAVLWRPLHEASGGWFWWGSKGAKNYIALYKLVFDRMVKVNGVRNAIWVWNSDGSDKDWYPGDEYVDIIARDFYYYPRETNHASLIGEFEKLKKVFGTKKIITLAENGSTPYPSEMFEDGAPWSYSMAWYGDYVIPSGGFDDNTADAWKKIMNSEYNLSLDQMPGWKSEAPEDCGIPDPCKSKNGIYQAECADDLNASIEKVACESGNGVNLINDNDYIKFNINIEKSGLYDISVGYALNYSGGKVVSCLVNGEKYDITLGSEDDEVGSCGTVALENAVELKAGENVIEIVPVWTWAVIDYIQIKESSATSAEDVTANNITVSASNDEVRISGAESEIIILDAAGRTISKAEANDNVVISIKDWSQGIYIVKIGDQTFKVIK